VNLLLPKMRAQETSSRIVMISSRYHTNARLNINDMHFSGRSSSTPSSGSSSSSSGMFSHWNRFCPRTAYANSKLATILFARALALRLEDTNVVAVALHPGRVSTSLRKNFAPEEVCNYVLLTIFQYFESIWVLSGGSITHFQDIRGREIDRARSVHGYLCLHRPGNYPHVRLLL